MAYIDLVAEARGFRQLLALFFFFFPTSSHVRAIPPPTPRFYPPTVLFTGKKNPTLNYVQFLIN